MTQGSNRSSRHQEETAVIEQVLDGNCNAYALLVERYNGSLYRYLMRILHSHDQAEDVAQEAFVRAYLSLAAYDARYRFSTWLFRIARNLALNWIKSRRKVVRLEMMRDEDDPPLQLEDRTGSNCPETRVAQRETYQQVVECIEELPDAYRSVVALRHFGELSYQEIADTMDLPINTVRSRLHRGRERLGRCLEDHMPQEDLP